MAHAHHNDVRRAAVARGWRSSLLTQGEYARRNGISDRTLRSWLQRYAPVPPGSSEEVRRVLRGAVDTLQRLLEASAIGEVEVDAPSATQTHPAPFRVTHCP